MAIQGLPKGMTVSQMREEIAKGARFVVFEYTISVLIMTFKRGSDIHYIPAGEGTFGKSAPYTLLTLVAGWWGIPWGPVYSIMCLVTNLGGGKDVTKEIAGQFGQ